MLSGLKTQRPWQALGSILLPSLSELDHTVLLALLEYLVLLQVRVETGCLLLLVFLHRNVWVGKA